MRRHLVRAATATLLTAVAFLDLLLAPVWPSWQWPRYLQWPVHATSWTALPGMMILSVFGVRGGPDGMPAFGATALATFLLWWLVLELGPSVLKKRRA
jgi:hypothetical protein